MQVDIASIPNCVFVYVRTCVFVCVSACVFLCVCVCILTEEDQHTRTLQHMKKPLLHPNLPMISFKNAVLKQKIVIYLQKSCLELYLFQ